ncbi:ankyrin repeat domain-containing protein [candidate division KSB1 bacterium]
MKYLSKINVVLILLTSFSSPLSAQDIHTAVQEDNLERVRILLTENPEMINSKNDNGMTPMHLAARNVNKDMIELLISKGADVNTKDNNNVTPLHSLAFRGGIESVKILVENGADINAGMRDLSIPLHGAARGGQLDVVEYLLSRGSDVNAKTNRGWNALTMAVYANQKTVIDFLIDKGSELNIQGINNWTPLHWAVMNNENDIAEKLVNLNADVNIQDIAGISPFHWTCLNGGIDHAKLFLEKGADINSQARSGMTPLINSIRRERKEIFDFLLEKNADIDISDNNGITALYMAVLNGFRSETEVLISKGAELTVTDRQYGRNLLHVTAIKGYSDLCTMLLDRNIDFNAEDSSGKTPLYYAGKYGHRSLTDLLIESGAVEEKLKQNFGFSQLLDMDLNEREAVVWYLGHSGYAVKTKNHLLVFDYFEPGRAPDEPLLANGHIDPEEIKDQKVHIFVSHDHLDHFDREILDWQSSLNSVKYIFGWQFEDAPGYINLSEPRTDKKIDNMTVKTINHSFDGIPEAAFVVEVDGLVLYHSGDHGRGGRNEQIFNSNIDYLAEIGVKPDLAFQCSSGAGQGNIALQGVRYFVDKLNPVISIPIHCGDMEYLLKEFADYVKDNNWNTEVFYPEIKGDHFIYKNGKISYNN